VHGCNGCVDTTPGDPEPWAFDVFTARHDDLKGGRLGRGLTRVVRSRVMLSAVDYPSPVVASEVAACLAVAVHGGMPLDVLPRL
jgi:hypothetical protein